MNADIAARRNGTASASAVMIAKFFTVHEWGFSCFPVIPRDKRPAIKSWKTYQSMRPSLDQIEEWDRTRADYNIAICTGYGGIFVLDADNAEAVKFIEDSGVPRTVRVRTAKGMHYYFRIPEGFDIRNTVRIREGVDIRGIGGFVVAPPSIHPTGARYEWLDSPDDAPISEPPAWLVEMISSGRPAAPPAPRDYATADNAATRNRSARYALAALENSEAEIASAPEGTRNDTLFKKAAQMFSMVEAGWIGDTMVADALFDAAERSGLKIVEIGASLQSARKAARPHDPLPDDHRISAPAFYAPPEFDAPPIEYYDVPEPAEYSGAQRRTAADIAVFEPKPDNRPPYEPPVVTIGDSRGTIVTVGALSGIIAGPGAGKSALMESIVASAASTSADVLGLYVRENVRCLYLDLERTPAETWDAWYRACRRAEMDDLPERVAWRLYSTIGSVQDRMARLRYDVEQHAPELVLIDDLGDLVRSVNDEAEVNDLLDHLGAFAKTAGFAVIATLHPNIGQVGATKARGHLGSALHRRAQAMVEILPQPDGVRVVTTGGTYGKQRHGAPTTAAFQWDDALGRFEACAVPAAAKTNGRTATSPDLFRAVFADGEPLTRNELNEAIGAERVRRGSPATPGTIRQIINRGVKMNTIEVLPSGRYALTARPIF